MMDFIDVFSLCVTVIIRNYTNTISGILQLCNSRLSLNLKSISSPNLPSLEVKVELFHNQLRRGESRLV